MDVTGFIRVSQSVVSRAWTRYQTTENVAPCHGGGRQKFTGLPPEQDNFLIVSAFGNRQSNVKKPSTFL